MSAGQILKFRLIASVLLLLLSIIAGGDEECKFTKAGHEYAGHLSVTVSGRTCQRWDSNVPHNHNYQTSTLYPEGSAQAAGNRCRNPDASYDVGVWCYTTDPKVKWELCDVNLCANGQWTTRSTGCYCYFDLNSNRCACCKPGGCQCATRHPNQCVKCGRGQYCGTLMKNFQWTERESGCQCDFDRNNYDCACCYPGGCQCPLANLHQCVQCGFPNQCGKSYLYEEVAGSIEWMQSRYDNHNMEEAVQTFTYITGLMYIQSLSKNIVATRSAGILRAGTVFSIANIQLTSNRFSNRSILVSEEEIYVLAQIENTVRIPPRSTLMSYHLVIDVAGTKIGCSLYTDFLNDTQTIPETYRVIARVRVQ